MALTLEQYAHYLDTRGLPWPAPPEIETPKAKPHLRPLPEVRVVTWSIYGTLLALTGGELYFQHPQQFIMDVALDKTVQEFKMWGSMSRKPGQPADYLKELYADQLQEQSSGGTAGKVREVAADRLWATIIKKLLQKDYKFDAGFYGSLNELSAKMAYFFHASLQSTVCYPGAAAALRALSESGTSQGFLADAQCFTLAQLQRGLSQQDDSADLADWINPELRAFSYQVGFRKPSEKLFRHLLDVVLERSLTPDQVLHVGSRIPQDVVPARRLGMRTALFAGDAASLQASPEQLKSPTGRPDVLLTELSQITEVVNSR